MLKSSDPSFFDVSAILEPRSIVVVGASDRAGNFGGATIRRLLKFGFKGPVWPVNRSGEAVCGLPSYPSVGDLPGVPDLAVLAVPAADLVKVVRDCIAKGVRGGVAFAGGFAEAGPEGARLQEELVRTCRDAGFALCGPNCVGVINCALPATPTFATALEEMERLIPGAISMVSQSGGIGTTVFSMAQEAGFGFRYLISGGNEAVVDFCDYFHALARDEGTQVIAGYLEGVRDAPKFVRALEEARRRGKSVVLIKAGASGASARAALAHTGALVGEDKVFDAVLKEFGVIRVNSVAELVDVAALLVGEGKNRRFGRGVGIVTFGGGNGVLAADQCAARGLSTPPLSQGCIERLKPLLASVATAANPIDLTPTTAFREELLARLPGALDVLAAEEDIDGLLVIVGTLAARAREIIEAIAGFAKASEKPVCVAWPSPPSGVREKLAAHGTYMFTEQADAIRAIDRLSTNVPDTGAALAQTGGRLASGFDWSRYIAADATETVIPEHRCHEIMRAAGLPVAEGLIAPNGAKAAAFAVQVGFPVAMKGISPAITHRAAAGLVLLDIDSEEAVLAGHRRLVERANALGAPLDGVYVQKMHTGDAELLVAGTHDPQFGPTVSVGAGGVMTELIDDVVTHRAPVSVETARRMLASLRYLRYAKDAEGPLPTDELAAFLAGFSDLVASAPFKRFIMEANPVKWSRREVVAVDGLIVLGDG